MEIKFPRLFLLMTVLCSIPQNALMTWHSSGFKNSEVRGRRTTDTPIFGAPNTTPSQECSPANLHKTTGPPDSPSTLGSFPVPPEPTSRLDTARTHFLFTARPLPPGVLLSRPAATPRPASRIAIGP